MTTKILALLSACFIFFHVHAQNNVVRGRITTENSEPLAGAVVRIMNTNITVTSATDGSFQFSTPHRGKVLTIIDAEGFGTKSVEMVAPSDKPHAIVLSKRYHQLPDVVVTAEKREDLAQQLPLAINSFNRSDIEQLRLTQSKELKSLVPGMHVANPGDNRNIISIRGVTSTSYDPAVATYIDGVNQFNLDTYIPELFDAEKVEVLRGPQGTLYGRNSMGGVVNIITRKPGNKTTVNAEITRGNYNLARYTLTATAPIVKNKMFFRVAAAHSSRDGYFTNNWNNREYDDITVSQLNYQVLYQQGNRFSVTANVKHYFNRNKGAFALIMGQQEAIDKGFELTQNELATMRDDIVNTSLSVNYNGSSFTLTSQTAYQYNYRIYNSALDADFSALDAMSIYNNYGNSWNNVKVWTQEFRLSSANAASKLRWTAGTYLFHQRSPVKQATVFGKDAPLMGVPDSMFSIINTSTATNKGIAVFGQLNLRVSDRIEISGGVRFDYEKRELNVMSEYAKESFTMVQQADTGATTTYNVISPKVGLVFKLTSHNNIYVNYSRGFRAGGLTQLSMSPSQPPLHAYSPEYSNNIEIGSKNQFLNNKLRLNLTMFYTTITNAQVPTLVLPEGFTVVRNAGKLTTTGVEGEIELTFTKKILLWSNFGYTNAKYKNTRAFIGDKEIDIDGKKQVFSPEVTSTLGASYHSAIATAWAVNVRAEWLLIGKQYFDISNHLHQEPVNLLNAGMELSYKKFGIMLWGKNVFNRRYIDYAYDFGAVHLADPATFGVTLRARF